MKNAKSDLADQLSEAKLHTFLPCRIPEIQVLEAALINLLFLGQATRRILPMRHCCNPRMLISNLSDKTMLQPLHGSLSLSGLH